MKEAIRISLIYIIIAALWIFVSDAALAQLNLDIQTLVRISQYKGFLFVLVTGGLLFFLVRKEINQKDMAIQELETTLQQKDAVMRELHHRIKNNLQNVISIIHLETGEQGLTELAKERIFHKLYALSAIHDLIYNHVSFHQISFRQVLENFFSYIAIPITEETLQIYDSVQYSLEELMPLMLGINELFEELASRLGNYHFVITAEQRTQIDITVTSSALRDDVIDIPAIALYLTGSEATSSVIKNDGSVTLRLNFSE